MIDWTKPVQTRDGRPVEIITTKGRYSDFPILGYIGSEDCISSWKASGEYQRTQLSHNDLINVPEPKVYLIELYADDRATIYFQNIAPATHKITITPGQPPVIEEVK